MKKLLSALVVVVILLTASVALASNTLEECVSGRAPASLYKPGGLCTFWGITVDPYGCPSCGY